MGTSSKQGTKIIRLTCDRNDYSQSPGHYHRKRQASPQQYQHHYILSTEETWHHTPTILRNRLLLSRRVILRKPMIAGYFPLKSSMQRMTNVQCLAAPHCPVSNHASRPPGLAEQPTCHQRPRQHSQVTILMS